MPDDPKLTHPLEELVAIAKGRCFGTKRGAVRCSLAARGGHITCKRHTAQEGAWLRYIDFHFDDYGPQPIRVYSASKSTHGPKWQEARDAWSKRGVEFISTWIDESGEGESADMSDLWVRCVTEAARCDLLIAYHLPNEQWKGAFVEIGAALAAHRPVYVIGQPPGSWTHHPLVRFVAGVDEAIDHYRAARHD